MRDGDDDGHGVRARRDHDAAYVEFQEVIRETVKGIGYTDAAYGFDYRTCGTLVSIHEQTPDISRGVDESEETRGTDRHDQGAGDQGMMFGFACNETESSCRCRSRSPIA